MKIFNKWLIWIKTQESSEIGGRSSTPGRGGWEKQVRNRNLQEIHQNQFQINKNLFKIHQRNSWHPSKKCPIDFHHFQGPWRTWDANSSWWRREGGDHSLNLLKKNPRLSGNYLRAIRAFLLTVPTAERVSKRLEKSFSVPWISWRFHNCPTLRDLFLTNLHMLNLDVFQPDILHFLAWSCKKKFSYWLIGTPSRISTWKNVAMRQPQKKRYCDNFTEVNILKDKSGTSTSMELFETLSTPAPLWNKC